MTWKINLRKSFRVSLSFSEILMSHHQWVFSPVPITLYQPGPATWGSVVLFPPRAVTVFLYLGCYVTLLNRRRRVAKPSGTQASACEVLQVSKKKKNVLPKQRRNSASASSELHKNLGTQDSQAYLFKCPNAGTHSLLSFGTGDLVGLCFQAPL